MFNNEDFKTGDVLLFRTNLNSKWKSWIAWAIRFFIKAKYNHVAVVVKNWDTPFINEALNHGVVSRSASEYLNRAGSELIVLRPVFAIPERDFAVRANGILGTKYDYVNLIFEQVHYRIFKKWLGRDKETEVKRMVCSEYAAYCLQPFMEKEFDEFWKWSAEEFIESKSFKEVKYEKL